MSTKSIGLSDDLHDYLLGVGVREPDVLRRLRDETASMAQANMQIAPEQGAFMALLVELTGARRCLEIGTFTGYSSTAVALALPADGQVVCCDVSAEWTDVARRYWEQARVADKVDLRLAPALETLAKLLADGQADSFDFAFVDAEKSEYVDYYEGLLPLLRPGGLVTFDNVFQGGRVVDADSDEDSVTAIRRFNELLAGDDRVSVATVPIADGLTLARKR